MILQEQIKDLYFHTTTLDSLYLILTSEKLKLSTSIATDTENQFQIKNKKFFLSVSRIPSGKFTKTHSGTCSATLNFKKECFNQYSKKSIDYWGGSYSNTEAEERIYSNNPYINIKNCIDSIHILIPFLDSDLDSGKPYNYIHRNSYRRLRRILFLLKKKNIDCFIYKDKNSFIIQNKLKAITLNKIMGLLKDSLEKEQFNTYSSKYDTKNSIQLKKLINGYKDLLINSNKDLLSPQAKEYLYQIKYYPNDFIVSIRTTIHNNKSSPIVLDFIQLLHKLTINSLFELKNYLIDKWRV